MRRIALLAIAAGCFVPLLASAPASAQATRTWVSGVGDDANPCSRTAPCKTFAGAISKTAAGGEINCLDPGGFGGLTTPKAITLNCGYTLGSVLVAGGPGITINAGVNDRVTLRGIHYTGINQTPTPGTIGVRILGAQSVSIEDCVISNFGQQGVIDTRSTGKTRLYIRNTVISNNSAAAISLSATNIGLTEIENTSLIQNQFGVTALTGNSVLIRRSVISGNTDTGVQVDAGAQIDIDNSAIGHNQTGIKPNGTVRLSNTDLVYNVTAVTGAAGQTYGNNRINGNGATGNALTAVVPAQQ